MKDEQNRIVKKLEKELRSMSDEQFWYYVSTWDDVETIVEDILGWDMEIQKEAIKDICDIKKRRTLVFGKVRK